MDPVAQGLAEPGHRLAPERAAQHDPARTRRVAEIDQRRAEGLGDGLEALEREAVAQQQRVVLIGLDDLLVAAFAAHDDQAAVLAQLGRCEKLPEARENLTVQRPDEAGDHVDAHPVLVEHPDEAVDLARRRREPGQVGGLGHLERDQVRVAGDEGHQLELAEDADHRVAVAHDHPVDAVAQHQEHRVEDLVIDRNRPGREARDLAHRELGRRLRPQQRVPEVGGGEDADAVAVADQGFADAASREFAAQSDDVGGAVDEKWLAQEGIADPGRHQQREFAPRRGIGPPRRGRAGFVCSVA